MPPLYCDQRRGPRELGRNLRANELGKVSGLVAACLELTRKDDEMVRRFFHSYRRDEFFRCAGQLARDQEIGRRAATLGHRGDRTDGKGPVR